MTAAEEMHHALIALTDRGLTPPCGAATTEHNAWTSDDHDQRARAALACRPCPLIDLCREFATEVKATHGVWAGIDLTKPTRQSSPGTPVTHDRLPDHYQERLS